MKIKKIIDSIDFNRFIFTKKLFYLHRHLNISLLTLTYNCNKLPPILKKISSVYKIKNGYLFEKPRYEYLKY